MRSDIEKIIINLENQIAGVIISGGNRNATPKEVKLDYKKLNRDNKKIWKVIKILKTLEM